MIPMQNASDTRSHRPIVSPVS